MAVVASFMQNFGSYISWSTTAVIYGFGRRTKFGEAKVGYLYLETVVFKRLDEYVLRF